MKSESLAERKPVALIGFMGTGKTAVGKRLARRLDYEFVDTDSIIEKAAGKPISSIFSEDGEEVFRKMETQALREALSAPRRVVSTGGGITTRRENREILMKDAALVLLTAVPEIILRRVQPLNKRPMLYGHPDPLMRIKSLLEERADSYGTYHFSVDTSYITPGQVADTIADWYLGLNLKG